MSTSRALLTRFSITLAFLLLLSSNLLAQADIVAKFARRTHTFQNITLPYRLFIPENYTQQQFYPLVLALHGSGERGTDNQRHIEQHRLATSWADPKNQVQYPCIVVAPQCPSQRYWSGDILTAVIDLLDSLLYEFSVAPNQQYVTGLSMGGYGTWELLARYPDRFAAAIPMSGGGNPELVQRYLQVPIWNFHGAIDDLVPVSNSRTMIRAMEQAGRTVIYTHCRGNDCTGLPDSTIARSVREHADLFYSEYKDKGHVMWAESYDYPHLFPWVFSKVRVLANAVHLVNLNFHRVLRGVEPIHWTFGDSSASVELWFSANAGQTWQVIASAAPNTGLFQWDTEKYPDCAFGQVKIFLKNAEGCVFAQDRSHYFTIDNSENGRPLVQILTPIRTGDLVEQSELELELRIGDPENDPLTLTCHYSADNGRNFRPFMNVPVSSDTNSQMLTLPIATLANSRQALVQLILSDGNSSGTDLSQAFVKQTPRVAALTIRHSAGQAGAMITAQVIDPALLTGQRYQIFFDDTTFTHKIYSVHNLGTGAKILENVPLLDQIAEGEYFDGMRLVIDDTDPAQVNFDSTGWTKGASTLKVSAYLKDYRIRGIYYRAFPQPSDYRIRIFDQVVDTSSAAFNAQPVPMKFRIDNLTENRSTETIFIDFDRNHSLSRLDYLYLLEPDSNGLPQLSWTLFFSGDTTDIPPAPGDEFVFKTLKPLTRQDVYEFTAILSDVDAWAAGNSPHMLSLVANYPNPFNPGTTITYALAASALVTLKVYNLSGQELKTLVHSRQQSGPPPGVLGRSGSSGASGRIRHLFLPNSGSRCRENWQNDPDPLIKRK